MRSILTFIMSLFMAFLALLSPWTPNVPSKPPSAPETGTETEGPSAEELRETAQYKACIEAGFPDSYALLLAPLAMEHPNWTFLPLDVTGLCERYTWDYVLRMEMSTNDNNLVPNQKAYQHLFLAEDEQIYDSGYRAASREAIAYYMDARNFLNETDIFQFFDVSAHASLDAVEAVLTETFMQGLLPDGSDTYAALFERVGEQYGISAVYLAVRGRMEHGKTGSPTAFGTCGTAISKYSGVDESALDGYYNFFNIGATGTGSEQILRNAALYAMKGKNGVVWNTLERSVEGGAGVLSDRFIANHQQTPYLLKFNVDVRSVTASGVSRNFWGQHAQNVLAAYSEGRTLARAFEAAGVTDGAYRFLIPVYGGMPETATEKPVG